MVCPDLLEILRCPESLQPLTLLEFAHLASLNEKISAGHLQNRAGKTVTEPLQAALLRKDSRYLYPIKNDIPVMLIDESIYVKDILPPSCK